jgi:hypothetical protein
VENEIRNGQQYTLKNSLDAELSQFPPQSRVVGEGNGLSGCKPVDLLKQTDHTNNSIALRVKKENNPILLLACEKNKEPF